MSDHDRAGTPAGFFIAATPAMFVLLWASGFIAAKLALPYAGPMSFLALRFAIVAALLLVAGLVLRDRWPRPISLVGHAVVSGIVTHAGYLGFVFMSLDRGVEAGVSSVIIATQPLVTAILASLWLSERVSGTQAAGLAIGFLGVIVVVWQKLGAGLGTPFGMTLSVLGMLSITLGTLYQKRFCQGLSLVTGNGVQFLAATACAGIVALWLDERPFEWTAPLVIALAWSTVVMSLGAITLLYLLIRRDAVSRMASLFYLVPPVTALIAWALFGETFAPSAAAGMVLCVAGVALVTRKRS